MKKLAFICLLLASQMSYASNGSYEDARLEYRCQFKKKECYLSGGIFVGLAMMFSGIMIAGEAQRKLHKDYENENDRLQFELGLGTSLAGAALIGGSFVGLKCHQASWADGYRLLSDNDGNDKV